MRETYVASVVGTGCSCPLLRTVRASNFDIVRAYLERKGYLVGDMAKVDELAAAHPADYIVREKVKQSKGR